MVERSHWGSVLVLGGALVSFGCSANDGAGRKANSGLESEKSNTALLCDGAGWNAAKVVATGFSGNDLILVRADGTRHTAHSFSLPPAAGPESVRREIRTGAERFTATSGATADSSGPLVGETVRMRTDGTLVWHLPGVSQGASDAGMGALVDGVPKLVRADGTMRDVPVPAWDSFEFLGDPDAAGWIAARWTLFNGEENVDHEGRVNLDGVRFDAARPGGGPDDREWELEEVQWIPTWLVHRPTNTRTPVQLDLLEPLRPLPGLYCNQATLLDDGRIGLGMRDDETAGFYVGTADGTGWERIGDPVRDVVAITGYRVGATWVLRASSGRGTYCPLSGPFASNSEAVVAGDSLQIVAPGLDPMIFGAESPWSHGEVSLDPTGTCAFRRDVDAATTTTFIDLTTGESASTAPLEPFTWL